MKNSILGVFSFCLLLSLSNFVTAESVNGSSKNNTYIGLDIFKGKSNLSIKLQRSYSNSLSKNFDQTGFRAKLGARVANNFRYEIYIKSENNDDTFDSRIYGFGLNAIKSFPMSNQLEPFILGGLISDATKLKNSSTSNSSSNLNAIGIKLGGGILYPLGNHIEILTGLDWQYRKWQDIELVGYSTVTAKQNDNSKTFYAGINFLF